MYRDVEQQDLPQSLHSLLGRHPAGSTAGLDVHGLQQDLMDLVERHPVRATQRSRLVMQDYIPSSEIYSTNAGPMKPLLRNGPALVCKETD